LNIEYIFQNKKNNSAIQDNKHFRVCADFERNVALNLPCCGLLLFQLKRKKAQNLFPVGASQLNKKNN
jgi:hypothetical protein